MELGVNAALVDASVWIAYFDANDALYQKAQSVIDAKENHTLIMTDYVLQEVITVFLYKKQPSLIEELLNTLQKENVEIVSVENFFLTSILKFIKHFRYKPKMSLTDWSLLSLAIEFGFPLLTFDKQLLNTHLRLTGQS
mgnify:FL=1